MTSHDGHLPETSRVPGEAAHRTLARAVITNVAAFAIFFVVYGLFNRIGNAFGAPWEVTHLTQMLADVLGVGIALRLNARFVALGLAGIAVSQLAKYLMHIGFGIEAVQGGPTQLAVMIAGVLGAILGGLVIGPRARDRGTVVDGTRA